MGKYLGARITNVEPGSIGAELGLEPGDILHKINDIRLIDFIDYLRLSSEANIRLEVAKKSGEIQDIVFEKDPDDALGLGFQDELFDGIRICANHCIFCFVRQLPPKQRPSLYIRDDDYRLSFLQGSYITLTNLSEADWRRIEQWRLSPLYISVHATDPAIRKRMLGSRQAGDILEQLYRLANAGITMHTQAVICPGINDGSVLEATIRDLARIWPAVASLAVVPVGLTKERRNLFKIEPFSKDNAAGILEIVGRFQTGYLKTMGTRFVYAADEWYITAGKEFPADEAYEDYWQLDNGVGLVRRFQTDLLNAFRENPAGLKDLRSQIVIVTGNSTRRLWEEVRRIFNRYCPDLELEVLHVPNIFFGPTVSVTGLLTGCDIIKAICAHPADAGAWYLIPQITLKRDEDVFLDGILLGELKTACSPKKVTVVPAGASEWLDWMAAHRNLITYRSEASI